MRRKERKGTGQGAPGVPRPARITIPAVRTCAHGVSLWDDCDNCDALADQEDE